VVDWIKYGWFKINVNGVDGLTSRHFWQNALKLIGICRACIRGRVCRRERIIQEDGEEFNQVFNKTILSDGHGTGLSLKLR
jgi:hypothetical protein